MVVPSSTSYLMDKREAHLSMAPSKFQIALEDKQTFFHDLIAQCQKNSSVMITEIPASLVLITTIDSGPWPASVAAAIVNV